MMPKYLYRDDDGERFTLQDDGKYTMDSSGMYKPYRYYYSNLIRCGFQESLEACHIVKYEDQNDGHGNEDDDHEH